VQQGRSPARAYEVALDDRGCRLAKEIGVKVSIATDAHRAADLDLMRFDAGQARRGYELYRAAG
jgi:DNA polymerase (family 10)